MKKTFEFSRRNKQTREIENAGNLDFSGSDKKAELWFYGDIVSSTWESYWYDEDKCPQDIVDFLAELNDYDKLDIYINSGGGSVHGGLAIYNILKRHNGEKVVHIDGVAASIASVIALAGDKVIIPSCAQFMIHKPWSSIAGDADDMRKQADALDSCQKAITAIYMEHVKEGITEDQITDMINRETWLTGEEATQYFDIEAEEKADIAACISDYFAFYTKTPLVLKQDNAASEYENQIEIVQLELDLLTV